MSASKMLTKRENYLSAGVHIGTTLKTKDMSRFIYKTRPNGLGVLNVSELDRRLQMLAKYMAKNNVLVVGRSRNAKKPLEKFSEATGIRVIAGRFMPGTLTNHQSKNYIEPDAVLLVDPSTDKQAMKEAIKSRLPVFAICDTFNTASYVDFIIPANNKSRKSIGLIFYLLARQVLLERREIKSSREFKYKPKDFIGEELGKK